MGFLGCCAAAWPPLAVEEPPEGFASDEEPLPARLEPKPPADDSEPLARPEPEPPGRE